MEYVEFFFGNFWHWLGLWVIVATIFGGAYIHISNDKRR